MNVQDTILKGIQVLLYRENFLILPGFGGFVLKPQSAGYNATATLLLPASKRPGFNRQLKQNDGVLQNWLQQELNCEAAVALQHLEEFAGYCNTLLSTKRRLNMKGLGFFYLDFENNLCFEAQSDVNFQSESFGLSPVNLLPIHEALPEVKTRANRFEDRTVPGLKTTEKATSSIPGQVKKTLLISVLVLFVLFTLGALLSLNQGNGKLYANLLNLEQTAAYSPMLYPELPLKKESPPKEILIENGSPFMIVELEPSLQIRVRYREVPSQADYQRYSEAYSRETGYFTVVLGSFSIPENAINFEKRVRSIHPENEVLSVIQHQHRMVSLGRYKDKELAREAMTLLAKEFPGAWILKR